MSTAVAAPPRSTDSVWAEMGVWHVPTGASATLEDAQARATNELAGRFAVLATQLAVDAAGVSAPRRLLRHPAYVEILLMGEDAVPLLLQRLQRPGGRPVWLSLLGMITTAPPGLGTETTEDATTAWLRWGKKSGYLSHGVASRVGG